MTDERPIRTIVNPQSRMLSCESLASSTHKWHQRPSPLVAELLAPGIIAGSLFVGLTPLGLALSDLMVGLAIIALVTTPSRYWPSRFTLYSVRVGAPLLLLSIYGLLLIPTQGASLLQWSKDAFSFVSFFATLGLLLACKRAPNLEGSFRTIAIGTILLVAIQASQRSVRRSGPFDDPNLAGSWLVFAVVTLLIAEYPRKPLSRYTVVGIGLVGIAWAGSFGSFAVLVSAIVALILGRRGASALSQVLFSLVAMLFAAWSLPRITQDWLAGANSIGPERLLRSSESRFEIWQQAWITWVDHPFGIGPGAFANSGLGGFQTHNDFIGVLVEVGPVGLALWLIALGTLFLLARTSRPLVLAFAVSSLTINALNFRHIWYLVAILIAMEFWADLSVESRSRPSDADRAKSAS